MKHDRTREYLQQLHDDPVLFLEDLWRSVGLPEPEPIQKQMILWMAHGPNRLGILAFRGASKTWVAIAYALWLLFRDPNERIKFISRSQQHAKDSLYMARKWLDAAPYLHFLKPDSKNRGQRDSALQFDVGPAPDDRTPSFGAVGIEGQITGTRATRIFPDDIETPRNTATPERRQTLWKLSKEFDNMIVPGGQTVFLGTPHNEETIYVELRKRGYAFQVWPARYPTLDEPVADLAEPLEKDLAEGRAKRGDPTCPTRFPEAELAAREKAQGYSTWLMQWMCISSFGDETLYPLKLRDLMVFNCQRDRAPVFMAWGVKNEAGASTLMDEIPCCGFGNDALYGPIAYEREWQPYTGVKMWIDPAGGTKHGDKTGYAIVGHLNGLLYALAVGGIPGGASTENLSALAKLALEWKVRQIFVEDLGGYGMLADALGPILRRFFTEPSKDDPTGWACSIEPQRVTGQKEVRIIESLEPVTRGHRLVVNEPVARNQKLQHQLTHITRRRDWLKHEDELESLAMCVRQWRLALSLDPEQAAERSKRDAMDQQVKDHLALAGVSDGGPRWFAHQ